MKYARVSFEPQGMGEWIIMEPSELRDLDQCYGDGPYTLSFVEMSEKEFEELPDFDGP